jgi:hypothetical protein
MAPKPSRGLHELIRDLNPARTLLVAPVDEGFAYNEEIEVSPLQNILIPRER